MGRQDGANAEDPKNNYGRIRWKMSNVMIIYVYINRTFAKSIWKVFGAPGGQVRSRSRNVEFRKRPYGSRDYRKRMA